MVRPFLSQPTVQILLHVTSIYLFLKVKKELRCERFESDLELNNAVMDILNRASKNGFPEFYKWIKRWDKCNEQNEGYFEVCYINV